MCFYVTDKTIYTADSDITCYKVINMTVEKRGIMRFTPYHTYSNRFRYRFGEVFTVSKRMSQIRLDDTIEYGFHSFITASKRNFFKFYTSYDGLSLEIPVVCTIPKGTFYRKNRTQYVSESIIIDYIDLTAPGASGFMLRTIKKHNLKSKFKFS